MHPSKKNLSIRKVTFEQGSGHWTAAQEPCVGWRVLQTTETNFQPEVSPEFLFFGEKNPSNWCNWCTLTEFYGSGSVCALRWAPCRRYIRLSQEKVVEERLSLFIWGGRPATLVDRVGKLWGWSRPSGQWWYNHCGRVCLQNPLASQRFQWPETTWNFPFNFLLERHSKLNYVRITKTRTHFDNIEGKK